MNSKSKADATATSAGANLSPKKTDKLKDGTRRSSTSPAKRGSVSKANASPSKSASINCISRIVELMMDDCCPKNLEMSEGLGADNMTCIIVEFIKGGE